MQQMRAIEFDEYGAPEVLHVGAGAGSRSEQW